MGQKSGSRRRVVPDQAPSLIGERCGAPGGARRSGASPARPSSCCVHQTENRMTASTATLRTTVAIPATSMLEIRLDAMHHSWRQLSDRLDLDHVRRPVAPCDRSTRRSSWPDRRDRTRATQLALARRAALMRLGSRACRYRDRWRALISFFGKQPRLRQPAVPLRRENREQSGRLHRETAGDLHPDRLISTVGP